MSTSLSGILNSISTCQNPMLSSKVHMEATSYGKAPNPYRDHLSLLVPLSSLGTNMFTHSVGGVPFYPGL